MAGGRGRKETPAGVTAKVAAFEEERLGFGTVLEVVRAGRLYPILPGQEVAPPNPGAPPGAQTQAGGDGHTSVGPPSELIKNRKVTSRI